MPHSLPLPPDHDDLQISYGTWRQCIGTNAQREIQPRMRRRNSTPWDRCRTVTRRRWIGLYASPRLIELGIGTQSGRIPRRSVRLPLAGHGQKYPWGFAGCFYGRFRAGMPRSEGGNDIGWELHLIYSSTDKLCAVLLTHWGTFNPPIPKILALTMALMPQMTYNEFGSASFQVNAATIVYVKEYNMATSTRASRNPNRIATREAMYRWCGILVEMPCCCSPSPSSLSLVMLFLDAWASLR